VTWLNKWLMLMQVGQGEAAAPAAQAASDGAAQATGQAAGQAAGPFGLGCGTGGGMMEFLIWMVFLFGLMYFLLIRPQRKQQKQHEKLLESLKNGDRIVTTGGVLGTVRGISGNIVTVEIAENVKVRIQKQHVLGLQTDSAKAEEQGKK
jgi:preprotein translocase subunit YajC